MVATGDTYVFAPSSSRDDALAYWFGPGVASWVAAADGRIADMYKLVANQRDLGALALWRTLGFSIVGTLPRAFRHSALGYVDAHVLHRSLDDVDA